MVSETSSLASALSIAVSGLNTVVGLINVASDNVANAQTPGYSEKTANVTNVDFGTSLGGSEITSYGRVSNQALSNNLNASTTQAGYYNTLNSYMSQVQTILDSTDSNPTLSTDIAAFSSAWTQYASQPSSPLQQQSVINAGTKLANDIQNIASQVGALQSQITANTQNSVTTFNSTLQQLASINKQIQIASTAGQQTASLEDTRDQLINTISGYTSVTVQQRPNDQVAVYTTSGQPLVDGLYSATYSYNGSQIVDSSGHDASTVLVGGSLQAQLDFVSSSTAAANSTVPGVGTIAKINAQLSTLVDSLTGSTGNTASPFADAYTAAYNASTGAGGTQANDSVASSFFTVATGTADPSTFAVNAALISGTSDLPETDVQGIGDSFSATANYSASGLSAKSSTYAELGTSILSSFQQSANTLSSESTTATSQQTYYQSALSSATGVNMDDELATLTALQNSYAASAHIISTVDTLLSDLINSIQ